jgi:hypothetical protein
LLSIRLEMALKCHCGNRSQFCPLRSAYLGKSTPELMPRRKTRRNLSEERTFGEKTTRAWAYKTDVKGMAVRFQAFDADPGLASSIKDEIAHARKASPRHARISSLLQHPEAKTRFRVLR